MRAGASMAPALSYWGRCAADPWRFEAHVTDATRTRHASTTRIDYSAAPMTATLVIGGSDGARRTLATHLPPEGFEPTFAIIALVGIAAFFARRRQNK